MTPPFLTSGKYMPHIVIQSADVRVPSMNGRTLLDDYLGVRFLSGPPIVTLGSHCDCELELMYDGNVDYRAVQNGATFTIREGGKIVGFGSVSRLNSLVDGQ